jgi:HPt (histidine-containing phosphotransfer) domain-containing protein
MEIPRSSQLKYLQRRLDEISSLKSTLLQGNFEPCIRVGHQLKGNAATFGLVEFQKIGQELEAAALNQDLPGSLARVDQIFSCATQKLNLLEKKE